MKNKYRNLFLLFGVLAIVVMLCTMDMDYSDIWENLKRVGFWFPVIMLLWFFVYLINTCSWYLIIRDDRKYRVPFWTVCKLSITGFAINYATPGGLMGGEPYRIMELSARIFSSLEIYIILRVFTPEVSGWDWVLILAFSSLFSNLIFFFPMQLGAREGGLALAVDGLHMSPALGVYVGLITRLRELLWIAIGMVLIKVGNRKPGEPPSSEC